MPLGTARSRKPTAVSDGLESSRERAPLVAMRSMGLGGSGGASRDRTGDLLVANQALSQLSYGPSLIEHGGSGRSCTSDLTLIRGAL